MPVVRPPARPQLARQRRADPAAQAPANLVQRTKEAALTATVDVPHADVTAEPEREKRFPLGNYDRKPQRRIEREWLVRDDGDHRITLQLDVWHTRGAYVASLNNARHEPANGVWCTAPMSSMRISMERTERYSKRTFEEFAERALQILRDGVAAGDLGEYLRGEYAPNR
jgi:hypothetical protein